jgi:hypothetical protein
MHLGIGKFTFGDLLFVEMGISKKNTFGDFTLGIKKTIEDFKVTNIWGWKNTFGDLKN